MVVHHVFDEVFRSRTHVAVLRALIDSATGCSGNEVARRSRMHPLSALKALTALEELGIVNRQRGGRDHLFTLNRHHTLVQSTIEPLFKIEQEFKNTIHHLLAEGLRGLVASAIVFGSVARGEETARSDYDLCCIVKIEAQKNRVRDWINDNAHKLFSTYGIKLSPIVLTKEELKKRSKSKFVQELTNDGLLIVGKKLKNILHE